MYRQLFADNSNFLYYLLATTVSNVGHALAGLAFLFFTYEMTSSTLHTTGIAITQALPYLLFGLVGGVVSDRVDRRKLLIWLDLLRAPLILSVVVFQHFNVLTYWHLVLISLCIQCAGCFYNPAHRALLAQLTEEQARTIANSLIDSVTRGATIAAPFLSVLFMKTIGMIHFFTFTCFAYAVSAFFVYKVARISLQNEASFKKIKMPVVGAIAEFFHWAKDDRIIRPLLLLTFTIVFFNTWVWQVGLLIQLLETTDDGEKWYATLQGVFGAVVIVSNLLLPFNVKKPNLALYRNGSIIWGVGLLFVGFSSSPLTYVSSIVLIAIGTPITSVTRMYLLQTYVPEAMRGRGFSVNAVLLYFSNVLSLSVYGLLATYVSTEALFQFSGVFMIITAFLLTSSHFTKCSRRHSIKTFK